jgi:tRNA modification GTPase
VVGVWTKRDAGPSGQIDLGESPEAESLRPAMGVVAVSAHSGAGLQELLNHVVCRVEAQSGGGAPTPDTPIVTRSRHRAALSRAADELADFGTAWAGAKLPAVVAAVHLRAAAAALEEIIGVVGVEDVLARVFADFCVGK